MNIKLGKIFDTNIFLHYSILLVVFMTSTTCYALLSEEGASTPLAIFLSGLYSLGVVASVLAHELAHVGVARRFNISCRLISLNALGGQAFMENKFKSPREEFLVAVAGPVVSIALLLFFGLLSYTVRDPDKLSPISLSIFFVAVVNGLLGVFNLIPAFPMDGGRVLRAALWKFSGNLKTATKIAVNVGYFFGTIFILAGIAGMLGFTTIFTNSLFSSFWAIVVGLFVILPARAELQRVA